MVRLVVRLVRPGVLVLLVLVLLLLLMVGAGHGAAATATAGTAEMVLVDKMVMLVVLAGDGGRGKPVRAEVVTGQVLAVVVGSGVVDVLNLIATAALLNNNHPNVTSSKRFV